MLLCTPSSSPSWRVLMTVSWTLIFSRVCFSVELKCAGITCPTLAVPECPSDSVLTRNYTPPSDCCLTLPPQCTCTQCPPQPECPSGHKAVIVSEATGAPGNCCDSYKCEKGKKNNKQKTEKEKCLFVCIWFEIQGLTQKFHSIKTCYGRVQKSTFITKSVKMNKIRFFL